MHTALLLSRKNLTPFLNTPAFLVSTVAAMHTENGIRKTISHRGFEIFMKTAYTIALNRGSISGDPRARARIAAGAACSANDGAFAHDHVAPCLGLRYVRV